MTSLIRHREIHDAISDLQQEAASIEATPAYQRDLKFLTELQALMNEYGVGLAKVKAILTPREPEVVVRKQRQVKERIYVIPSTGERITHRGGPNARLTALRKAHGRDVVETWRV